MQKILEEVKNNSLIAISGHVRPDGDCIGACMGMYLYLKKALPEAEIDVYLESPAPVFSCIKGIDEIKRTVAKISFTTYASRSIRRAAVWAERRNILKRRKRR